MPETTDSLISSESDSAALAPLLAPSAYMLACVAGEETQARTSRRPKGTGTVQSQSPHERQLRVVGVDLVNGCLRLTSRTVNARNETEAQSLALSLDQGS